MQTEILHRALEELRQLREHNAEEQAARQEAAIQACPEIGEVLGKRQSLIYEGIRGLLHGDKGINLEEQMAAQNARLVSLLKEIGKPADWLEPIYACPYCKDTGYVGETIRTECHCLQARCNRLFAAEALADDEDIPSFDHFDLNLFPDEKTVDYGGVSQRFVMDRAFSRCKAWATCWPEDTHNTILLTGKSGLGKTYLLRCMARAMAERGLRVTILSAFRFVELARRYHMTMESDAFDELLQSDVVMIDDIGSEPMMSNITPVYLLTLIDERQSANKATVITTNLTPSELQRNYSERIASRLTDQRISHVIELLGEDIRKRK